MEKAKEAITALIWLAGVIVLASEAGSLAGQALNTLAGFTLWGIAYIVWAVWGRIAAAKQDKPQTDSDNAI